MAREPILQNQTIGHLREGPISLRDASESINPAPVNALILRAPGRDRTSAWHKAEFDPRDLGKSHVSKALTVAKNITGESIAGGTHAMAATINKVVDTVKASSQHRNLRDLIIALAGGTFGLGFIKNILGIPKLISDPKYAEKQSPLLISGAKWVAGGTMAFGLLRGLMGGAGLSGAGMATGLLAFIVPYALSSLYENENSIFSKLTSTIGLREKIVDLMDSLKFSNILS